MKRVCGWTFASIKKFVLWEDFPYVVGFVLYVVFFTWQTNIVPFERYPGWDYFWVDTRTAGTLISFRDAIKEGGLPLVVPYTGFGWNLGGNHTSFWNPLNFLVFLFSPGWVIQIQQMLFGLMGAVGVYFFLGKFTKQKWLAFVAGLAYISVPYVLGLFHFTQASYGFYAIPLFLILIHKILDQQTSLRLFLFTVFSAFTIGVGDIYFLIVLFTVVILYSLLLGIGWYRFSLSRALKKTALLFLLAFLAGAFYIVPLINNVRHLSEGANLLREAGISMPVSPPFNFFDFFYHYGVPSFYLPIEGNAVNLYIPAFFYVALLGIILRYRAVYEHKRQLFVVVVLLLLGLSTLLESFIFYSPFFAKLFPGLFSQAHGILRYHINLIPFMNIIAGFLSINILAKIPGRRRRWLWYGIIIGIGWAIDMILFYGGNNFFAITPSLFAMSRASHPLLTSSNTISVRVVNDMWLLLPWLNALFALLIFVYAELRERSHRMKYLLVGGLIVGASIFGLLNASIHNELLVQKQDWQLQTNNSYRFDAYRERKSCIDKLIARYDPSYRTLYAGKNFFAPGGRNWKSVAETELHVEGREKILFSYREFEEPYTALLRSTFRKGDLYRASNLWPPMSQEVGTNLEYLKFMGVRNIISTDEKIDNPNLVFQGTCSTAVGPLQGAGGFAEEGGMVYVYQLKDPFKIAFLASRYETMSAPASLRNIYEHKEYPWLNDTVDLEEPPKIPLVASVVTHSIEGKPKAEIVRETYNSVELDAHSDKNQFLVLSYIYRPFWRAYINGVRAPIYRAYGGFMAVSVPAGNSVVTFKYYPYDVYFGFFITIGACVSLLFLGISKSKRQ